ncbi:hypothetical protein LBMAG42_22980 [Deltaproteobacteria bacterium]|nr:hypothetical protein LBMAG42_22980 [Deltaproteobacteria bacterium]
MSVLLLSLFACDPAEDTGPSPTEFSDCDPIAYERCATPFPSSFYLRDDATSPTGVRVHLGATTIPYTQQGDLSYQPDPKYWNELDGFSPMGPLIVEIPGMSADNLPGHASIGASLEDGSALVLLDWDTGERFPAWAELDYAGYAIEGSRSLYIRPAMPLLNGHRYVVALRNIVDTAGAPKMPSEGFAALRDGTETDTWDIEGRRELYEDIFTRLEADGWARSEVTVAWDFTVKSADAVGAKIGFMQEDAAARVGTSGPPYVIDSVVEYTVEENAHTWKRVYGRMTVPRYTEEDEPGTLLTRDSENMPEYAGDTTVPFTIVIPRTAETDPRPLKLLQYGHGLLGSQDEVEGGYLSELSDRYGYILFAVNWTGMDEDDYDAVALMLLGDLSRFAMLPERSQQGYLEFAAATWMMKGAMVADEAMSVNGTALIDPSEVFYYGNSQGAILGGGYVAVSKDITRATLGVGGMPYSLLLTRSADFIPFFAMFQSVYDDERDLVLWMALLQQVWDPGEAGGFGRQMNMEPLPGVPAKDVLLQDALGDAQVTTLGAHNMARAYGAVTIDPPVNQVWGVETVAGPHAGSALVEFDFAAPIMPQDNTAPDDEFDTHEDTRRAWAAQEQMAHFFETGEVVNECQGACLCAVGQCDEPVDEND